MCILFLNINLHECGHLLCGKMTGYQFSYYQIGSIRIAKSNGHLKIFRFSQRKYGGICAMIATKNPSIFKSIMFYSGGILANILCLIFLVLAFRLASNLYIKDILFLSSFSVLLLVIGNLLPITVSGQPSDGKLIFSMLLHKRYREKVIKEQKLEQQIFQGTRPRDLIVDLSIPSANSTIDAIDVDLLLYTYIHFLDGTHQHLDEIISFLEEHLNEISPIQLPPVLHEFIYYYSAIDFQQKKAQHYYKCLQKYSKNPSDCNSYRILSAYEYFVNLDSEKAKADAAKGLALIDMFPLPGQAHMERDLIDMVYKRE